MCRAYGARIHIAAYPHFRLAYARLQCGLTSGRASGALIFEFLRPSCPPDRRETPALKRSPSCSRLSKIVFSGGINARRFWKRFL
jgi:hypothetical protein